MVAVTLFISHQSNASPYGKSPAQIPHQYISDLPYGRIPPPSQLISTPDTSEASQLFFRGRGERVSHLKSTMRTLRGSEGEGPRTIARFQFLKRFKVLENESIFQKYQHFSCPKSPFYKNNFDKLNIHYRNFWSVSKNILKFSRFYDNL